MARFSKFSALRRLAPAAVDLSRLRGVLIVVAGGAAIFAATNYVLDFALGADAAAVYPRQRPLGVLTYARIWGRVSAIDRMYQRGQLPPDTRLGVYIGVSTTATGIQRRYLDARATAADRWIVLTGAGLSFENIENVMQPVFFCSLKPATVVFGVHPQMLVGERYLPDEPTLGPQRVVGRRGRGLAARLAASGGLHWLRRHWAIRHHALMAEYLRSWVYGLRLWVFYTAGVSAERLFPPAAEPWDEDPLPLWNMDDVENQFADTQLKFWTRRGHFKAENYDPDGAQARSLIRMIRAFRERGAKVYVVLMPLRSTARELVPPNAKPCLREVLHRAFPEAPPTVIDLEEALPDQYFTDLAHLSKSGAVQLSKLVAEHLRAPPAGENP